MQCKIQKIHTQENNLCHSSTDLQTVQSQVQGCVATEFFLRYAAANPDCSTRQQSQPEDTSYAAH